MAFDPKKHIIRIQGGREYLPVAARLIWFRSEHPDWGIVTNPVEINIEKQYSIFSCQIFNAEGKLMATATKMENIRGFADYLEKSETGAVGRALAYCGYGTQFAPELEEENRLADAPYPSAESRSAGNARTPNANRASEQQSGFSSNGNGGRIMRVREPDRENRDPAGPGDDEEDPFAEGDDPTPAGATTPTPAAEKPNPLAGNHCSIEGCPNVLTAGQMTMTTNKFGRALCLLHQKDAQPIAASTQLREGAGAGGTNSGRRGQEGL